MNRLTLRARLTVIYGGLLVLAGALLLGVTYVLVSRSLPNALPVNAPVPVPDRFEPGTTVPSGATRDEIIRFAAEYQQEIRSSVLNSLLTQSAVALVVVTSVAVVLGWLVAGQALQPLHQITATARRIAAAGTANRGLHERIALSGPADEVRELAATFDEMVERLDRSFDGQRRFVANASHEMRTPLALNRALVEVAVTRPDASADVQRLGEALLSVNERHERLIDGLLTLADSENDIVERIDVDLAAIARHVADQAPMTIDCDLRPAHVRGDPVLLERVTHNLVENAVRYNVDGGWVRVTTGVHGGAAELVVENTGQEVPPYEVETIFQPFRRLHGQRTGQGRGFGLGLSIVRAVAGAHGGQVMAQPRAEGGLVVRLRLPSAPA